MNVMNLIKKGPKKLRGPAAAAAKKKLAIPVVKKKVIDKQNPFRNFIDLSDNEMYEEINNFIQKLSPINDRELIKTFNLLKNGIPWTLVKPFFIEFDESNSNNIVRFFETFSNQPNVKTRISNMKTLISQRNAIPFKNGEKIPNFDIKQQKFIIPPKINPLNPKNRTLFGNEFPLKCEQEYRRAPWMYNFTKEPIRGFALRNEIPEYTTEGSGENPIKTLLPGNWYVANMKWYRDVCKNGRKFNTDVAYLTASGDLIIETKQMFESSKKGWEDIIDIEFSQINEHSFDIAKTILMDNPILANYSSKDIDAILASIANKTNNNYDMARGLSWVLAFLSKITKEPQIHHYRVKNHQYKPEDLVLLDRYTLLPEIYKNPDADSDEVEYIIKSRRRFIEKQFYSRLQPIKIGERKKVSPLKPEVYKYLSTDARSKCPPNAEDVMYYEEDGVLYCFNRSDIENVELNPNTGKKFSSEFLQELSHIAPPKLKSRQEQQQDIIIELRPDIELAPGLFQKLKDEIELITPIYCSNCNVEIVVPKYKSIKDTQKVQFCDKECFDKFQF